MRVLSCFMVGALWVRSQADLSPADAPRTDETRLTGDAAKLHAALKARPEEMKWRKVPWLLDLNEGLRVAKEEKRPLLLWTSQQSHPLERN